MSFRTTLLTSIQEKNPGTIFFLRLPYVKKTIISAKGGCGSSTKFRIHILLSNNETKLIFYMLPYYLFCIKLVTVYRLTFAPVLFSPTVVSARIFNGRITNKLEKLHNVHEKFTHGVPMFDVFFVWFICTSVDLTWFNYDIFFKISRKHPRLFIQLFHA